MGMSRLLANASVAGEHPPSMTAINDWLVGTSVEVSSALKNSRALVLLHYCKGMNKNIMIRQHEKLIIL